MYLKNVNAFDVGFIFCSNTFLYCGRKIERKFRPITLAEPGNSFEQSILEFYDRFMAESLRKYFLMLNDMDIKQLLRDNYLQKNDFKKLLESVK